MKCIECGHELKDGAVFCIRCGAMQVSMDNKANEVQNAPVRPSVANAQTANARHNTGKNFKPAPRRSTASIVVPIVAVVAVLGAAGALAMFVLNPGSSSSDSASQTTVAASQSATTDSTASASTTSTTATSTTSSSAASTSASSKSSTSTSSSKSSSSTDTSRPTIVENTSTNNNNNNTQQYTEPEPFDYSDYYWRDDTSSRYYSRGEVEDMSNYDLYFARNEIYARHGRMFKNSDLQDYFNGKTWYHPTYTPEQFDSMASPLSDIEKKNVELMLSVEKSRNSPYV